MGKRQRDRAFDFSVAITVMKCQLEKSDVAITERFSEICRQEKKWWLIPLVVVLLVCLGAILIFTASSGIVWALYPFL